MRRGSFGWLALTVMLVGCWKGASPADDSSDGSDSTNGSDAGTEGGGEGGCEVEGSVPDRPNVIAPNGGELFPHDLGIEGSAFSDPDDDQHAETEFEIWLTVGGEPSTRVWSATITSGAQLTTVSLADGEFEVGSQLTDRSRYSVRVRYRDSSAECAFSEWSESVTFTADESVYMFDPDSIHTFEIEIPPESWDPINAEAEINGCNQVQRTYYGGTLKFEDQVFERVGIRAKGGCGSSRDLSGKAAFKINLEWDDPDEPGCPGTRRLFGLDTITLNNAVQDTTAMHERMAYRMYRTAGIPGARAVSARVVVNGELWGLYVHVESQNRRFLRRWFEDPEGMMYEGAYWCDLVEANVPDMLDADTCFQREFKETPCSAPIGPGEDARDWGLLRDLTQRIAMIDPAQFHAQIGEILEFDSFLTMMAVEGVLAHWDGYPWQLNNNYRVYHHPDTDRWTVLPWGTDQTFDRDMDPWVDATGVIAEPCLQSAECEEAYAQRLHEMVDLFEQLDFAAEVMAMTEQLESHVEEDPRKEFGISQWHNRVSQTLDFIATRGERIRGILMSHGY